MPLDERILAANAAARENAKQVLTIDVAVLTVGLALINALPDGVRLNSFGVLVAAILLLASGLAAVLVLDWTYRELRDGKAEERIGLWQTVELSLLLAGAGVAAGTAILAATT